MGKGSKKAESVLVLPFDHPQLEPFKKLPQNMASNAGYQILSMVPFLLGAGVLLVLFALKVLPETGPLAGIVTVSYMVLGLWSIFPLARTLLHRHLKNQKERDVFELGAAEPSERYVGISYGDGIWAFRQDSSWDRGYLKAQGGYLYFHGFGPSFQLPLKRIESVEQGISKAFVAAGLPRVFVVWRDIDGAENTIVLEVHDAGSHKGTFTETQKLEDWLREQVSNAEDVPEDGELFPFRSSKLDMNFVPIRKNIKASDRALGFLAAFLFYALVIAALIMIKITTGKDWLSYNGGFLFMALVFYHVVIATRVKARAKDRQVTNTD